MFEKTMETAEFRIIGRLAETPILKVSSSGTTNYCKPSLKVKAGPKAYERKWFLVCFGGIAEEFSLQVAAGDTVEAKGELQIQKNKVTERWETSFIMREFKVLAQAPENDTESIAEAFGASDLTDIDF